jgi:hypothetical protein
VQQDHAVDDLACGIALGRPKRPIMQLELRQDFAAGKAEILEHEIALAQVRPRGRRGLRGGGSCGKEQQGGGQGTDRHL